MGKIRNEQHLENNCSDGAMGVLNRRIAEWTDQKERYLTAVPGL